uniref:Uncharacterized protein n=1 Tax=Nymphaea colorata TaxID=210225 RepID=A0A5K1DRY5_9MAGN
MAPGVPIPDEHGEIVGRVIKGNGDVEATVDAEAAEGAGSLVHGGGREVEVAADLVLDLKVIGKVAAGGDGAVGAGHAVHPGVLPLLNAAPGEQEGLVQLVEHVDDDVVVGGGVDVGSRELPID